MDGTKICGLQKLAMVDYPGKVAATVFTGGCNLRCPFCHNALLVTRLDECGEEHTEDEVLDFLRSRQGLLDGVVLSGGEPLIQDGVEDFAAAVKALGFAVKLDTNGCYPARLRRLLESRAVDYVAMDVKNCLPKYPQTVGARDFDAAAVEESAALLMEGLTDYEFRTTVVREFHTPADIAAVGNWLRGAKRYCLQSFLDSGGLIVQGLHGLSSQEMQEMLEVARPFFKEVLLRGVN